MYSHAYKNYEHLHLTSYRNQKKNKYTKFLQGNFSAFSFYSYWKIFRKKKPETLVNRKNSESCEQIFTQTKDVNFFFDSLTFCTKTDRRESQAQTTAPKQGRAKQRTGKQKHRHKKRENQKKNSYKILLRNNFSQEHLDSSHQIWGLLKNSHLHLLSRWLLVMFSLRRHH